MSNNERSVTLQTWDRSQFQHGSISHDVYRKGTGPGVIVIHEIPGMTPKVIAFGEEIVAAGFTTLMPNLFGTPDRGVSVGTMFKAVGKICVSKEMSMLAAGQTPPITQWLRALARSLHGEVGGPGVGALGMCFTGGYALGMMVDAPVIAPVLCQPSTPAPVGKKRAADLGLSPADLAAMRRIAIDNCPVLGLRFANDKATGTKFETLTEVLGEKFIRVEFEGKGHSTVTEQRQQAGVDRVLEFFADRLQS